MSDTVAGLSRKMSSAKDLQSVVRTMKALAASSIGQYEQSVRALGEYYRTVELGLGVCLRPCNRTLLSAVAGAQGAPVTVNAIVFGSDQGLVGRFNEVVAEHAIKALGALGGTPQVWAVGERVLSRLGDADLSLAGLFPVPSSVQGITSLVDQILVKTAAQATFGENAQLYLFHNRPAPGSVYTPFSQRLLPLDEVWCRKLAEQPWPTKPLPEVVGATAETLRAFIRDYLFVTLFRACAESLAAENASRLAAMQRADSNINDLLETLQGTFHRLRQSGIDAELFDVIAGFEALVDPAKNQVKPEPSP